MAITFLLNFSETDALFSSDEEGDDPCRFRLNISLKRNPNPNFAARNSKQYHFRSKNRAINRERKQPTKEGGLEEVDADEPASAMDD